MLHHGEWALAIGEFLVSMQLLGASRATLETRRQHLNRMARRIRVADPWAVSEHALLTYMAAGAQSWATETHRAHRSTLRQFYAWGVEAGHVEVSPARSLPRVRPAAPRPRPCPDRAYIEAVTRARPRERVMLRLAAEVGLRRGEVAQVHSRDLFEDLTGWSLVVHGKGGKERVVPLTSGIAHELRSLPAGWAFPGDYEGHLSPRWVGTLVGRLLPGGHTMHGLRHRFATRSYEVDHDLAVVQELLGHASPATTRIYVAVGRDRLRATVEAVSA